MWKCAAETIDCVQLLILISDKHSPLCHARRHLDELRGEGHRAHLLAAEAPRSRKMMLEVL